MQNMKWHFTEKKTPQKTQDFEKCFVVWDVVCLLSVGSFQQFSFSEHVVVFSNASVFLYVIYLLNIFVSWNVSWNKATASLEMSFCMLRHTIYLGFSF